MIHSVGRMGPGEGANLRNRTHHTKSSRSTFYVKSSRIMLFYHTPLIHLIGVRSAPTSAAHKVLFFSKHINSPCGSPLGFGNV